MDGERGTGTKATRSRSQRGRDEGSWAVPLPLVARLEISASEMLTQNLSSKARNGHILVERDDQSKRKMEEERAKK